MMDLESRLSLVEHPFGISMEEEWTSACMEPVSSRRCPALRLVRAGRDRVALAVPNLDFPPFLVFLHPRCSFPDVAQCRNAGAAILVFDVPYESMYGNLLHLCRWSVSWLKPCCILPSRACERLR